MEKSWAESLKAIVNDRDPFCQAKLQYEKSVGHISRSGFDNDARVIWGALTLIFLTTINSALQPTATAIGGIPLLLTTMGFGYLLPFALTTYFPRGDLTVRHYDLKRVDINREAQSHISVNLASTAGSGGDYDDEVDDERSWPLTGEFVKSLEESVKDEESRETVGNILQPANSEQITQSADSEFLNLTRPYDFEGSTSGLPLRPMSTPLREPLHSHQYRRFAPTDVLHPAVPNPQLLQFPQACRFLLLTPVPSWRCTIKPPRFPVLYQCPPKYDGFSRNSGSPNDYKHSNYHTGSKQRNTTGNANPSS
jgi:hypothetical protein